MPTAMTDPTPERFIVDAMAAEIATQFSEAIRKDLRAQLIAFGEWLLEGEYGENKVEQYVDNYLAEKDQP